MDFTPSYLFTPITLINMYSLYTVTVFPGTATG